MTASNTSSQYICYHHLSTLLIAHPLNTLITHRLISFLPSFLQPHGRVSRAHLGPEAGRHEGGDQEGPLVQGPPGRAAGDGLRLRSQETHDRLAAPQRYVVRLSARLPANFRLLFFFLYTLRPLKLTIYTHNQHTFSTHRINASY